MHDPVTTIDARYSDPEAVATPWEETRRVLESAELFWVVTVRADGRPHMTPLVAVWLDGALHFCTGSNEQKALNLHGNPHVILATGSIQWNAGLDLVFEGDAVQVTDEDRLKRLAEVWTTKWDGRWQYEIRNGAFRGEGVESIPVFSVTPTRVFAFAEGPCFGQTRHKF
ncbi:MAG TPA: pyridoxamine 5'-phosphate oxidase family protein [Ktedonobacterales bacterium]|nr:pyridoxamine 5'-phosphate oxidase family protein [Ktedonobacterales bacterium]